MIGLLSGAYAAYTLGRPGFEGDFEMSYNGTRLWLAGVNPYGIKEYAGELLYSGNYLIYPLPTLWLLSPLAWLPSAWAGALFFGLSAGGLAYLVTRNELWRLHLFASGSFVMAASLAQWSPLLMVAALVPAAGVLCIVKPSVGLAVFAYRPSLRLGIACAAVLLVSVAVLPTWPMLWLRGSSQSVQHTMPVLSVWGGPLLLLASLRWRTPGGRLLLTMACVPQFTFFYDQLLLFLIPRTRQESAALAATNLFAMLAWMGYSINFPVAYQQVVPPFVIVGCYLPALVLVLRQPNVGEVPLVVERVAAWLSRRRLAREPEVG